MKHFVGILSKHAHPIFCINADESKWNYIRKKKLNRHHADFIRVRTSAGLLIVSTAPVGKPVNAARAIDLLADALMDIAIVAGQRTYPISTSRGWALHEERQSAWQLVRLARRDSFDAVSRLVLDSGFACYSNGRFVGWRFPDHLAERERLAFFTKLAAVR